MLTDSHAMEEDRSQIDCAVAEDASRVNGRGPHEHDTEYPGGCFSSCPQEGEMEGHSIPAGTHRDRRNPLWVACWKKGHMIGYHKKVRSVWGRR